jgi:hypothetical protein
MKDRCLRHAAAVLGFVICSCQAYVGTWYADRDGNVHTHTRYWQVKPWITSDDDFVGPNGERPREQSARVPGFSGVGAEQQGPDWCWAASIQMVLDHAGIRASQREIVGKIFPDYKRRGSASVSEGRILDALNQFAQDRYGFTHRLTPVALQANPWNNYLLITTLQGGYPVIAGLVKPRDNFGHVVVVYKVRFRQGGMNQVGISEVSYYDPNDGLSDTLSGREFAQLLRFAIATNVN